LANLRQIYNDGDASFVANIGVRLFTQLLCLFVWMLC
jgi:hypothetical protein